jgi:hypothetical protein
MKIKRWTSTKSMDKADDPGISDLENSVLEKR